MHTTDKLIENLHRAAHKFCTDHQLGADQLPRITEAVMHGALFTLQFQNERATADAVTVHAALEDTEWSDPRPSVNSVVNQS